MQMARHSSAAVDVFADSFEPGGLVEVGRTDALAHNVPILAGRDYGHLLLIHDILELLAHLANFAHGFVVDEMFLAPRRRVPATQICQKC